MWCPSATLSTWANAWLAGRAAPDDVLDALSVWAPTQSVAAYDSVAAGDTGLPWPEAPDAGAASLLQTLRAASGHNARSAGAPARIALVLPVPGDVSGLPAGTRFEAEALAAGEAVIIAGSGGSTAVGLVPDSVDVMADAADGRDTELLSWTVYAVPDMPAINHHDLGDAEYAMRSAVRSAADTLGAMGPGRAGVGDNPRRLVAELVESVRQHRIPDHAPPRAVRVLENAAHVDAIITVGSELATAGAQSSSESRRAAEAMRPLAALVRSARAAAVDAILRSAW